MTPAAGRRGSRSDSVPVRPDREAALDRPPPPARVATLPPTPPSRPQPGSDWTGPLAGLAVGTLLGRLALGVFEHQARIGAAEVVLAAVGILLVARLFALRRARARPAAVTAPVPRAPDEPPPARSTDLDRGVRDIRRSDPGFDPSRFAGYAGMTFRDVQGARMIRDVVSLCDRVTPQMYRELQAFCDGLRTAGRSIRFGEVDVVSATTEAWQDGDRDYVTAYVAGSMLSHTVDDATGQVVGGSRATAGPVEAFLTFTRPAGLNFWMLSVIQEPCP